jgi:hypothetical protein
MNRWIINGLLTLVVLVGFGALEVVAQNLPTQPTGQPPYRPPVSPYINLLRRGGNPAINYYGLVRPQIEFSREIRRLDQDLATRGQQGRQFDEESGLPTTGHAASFMNYSHYFNLGEQRSSLSSPTLSRSAGMRSSASRASISSRSSSRAIR